MERAYSWPWLRDDVETYMKTCLVCQKEKGVQRRPAELLKPLPTPKKPWESIPIDFIVALPKGGWIRQHHDGCGKV